MPITCNCKQSSQTLEIPQILCAGNILPSITEEFRLEGTSGSHLAHPPTQSRANLEQVARDLVQLGSKFLQRGRSMASWGNLFQWRTRLMARVSAAKHLCVCVGEERRDLVSPAYHLLPQSKWDFSINEVLW